MFKAGKAHGHVNIRDEKRSKDGKSIVRSAIEYRGSFELFGVNTEDPKRFARIPETDLYTKNYANSGDLKAALQSGNAAVK